MNVSMQDGFNLGWKLASVIRGQCLHAILDTYSDERRTLAKELIDFDRAFAKMFSARPTDFSTKAASKDTTRTDGDGIDPAEFQRYFVKQGRFTAGTAVHYAPSLISAAPAHQHLATGFVVGMRFHSARVIRLADARPLHLGHVVKADGRWRLFLFSDATAPDHPTSRLRALCDFLDRSDHSPVRAHTPAAADIDSVIDARAIFQQAHRDLASTVVPDLLRPRKGRFGLIDYEKVFCPDLKSGDIFDQRGIDRSVGSIVVVRPDQFVANVLPLNAHEELAAFFRGFMMPAGAVYNGPTKNSP
jgi:phenol 2-monooxygenase